MLMGTFFKKQPSKSSQPCLKGMTDADGRLTIYNILTLIQMDGGRVGSAPGQPD